MPKELTDDLEIHFVELPKWERVRPKDWTQMNHLERWLTYFSQQTTDDELEAMAMADPMIQEALSAEGAFMLDPVLLSAYDAEEDERRDRVARETYVRKKTMEEVVVKMLRAKQPIELIAEVSEFPSEKVLEIRKRYNI